MIAVPAAVLAETFTSLRGCGKGRRECVVYWLGPTHVLGAVDENVHPLHAAGRGGYEIDDRWLTAFWFDLARRRRSVRVQVHTHPRAAFHSPTDDDWPLVHTPGFLSLVIPDFATGPIGLEGAFLAERVARGWRAVPIPAHIQITESVAGARP